MKTQTAPTKEQLEELYGSPSSLRLPVNLKKRITEDALLRGQTFSSYAGDLIATAIQKGQEKDAEISLLIREKEQLQQRLQKHEQELGWLSESDKEILQKLKRNRAILESLAPNAQATRQDLSLKGFDFRYATSPYSAEGKQFFAVFDYCYSVQEGQVSIIKL